MLQSIEDVHVSRSSFIPFSLFLSITVEMVAFYSVWVFKSIPILLTVIITEHLRELEFEDRGPRCENPRLVLGSQSTALFFSSLCVCMCVLFFQNVIVIPMAQSVIAVMAQDFVYVRRALQGLSVRSVCPAICGTMAANVSRTVTLPVQLLTVLPPLSCVFLFSSSSLMSFLSAWFLSFGWKKKKCAAHAQECHQLPWPAQTQANPIRKAISLITCICISHLLRLH